LALHDLPAREDAAEAGYGSDTSKLSARDLKWRDASIAVGIDAAAAKAAADRTIAAYAPPS
jgi:hypothetical protein